MHLLWSQLVHAAVHTVNSQAYQAAEYEIPPHPATDVTGQRCLVRRVAVSADGKYVVSATGQMGNQWRLAASDAIYGHDGSCRRAGYADVFDAYRA